MALFKDLESDMKFLIETRAKIAEQSQLLLHHNDANDKRNFSPHICEAIKKKNNELWDKYYEIYNKWF